MSENAWTEIGQAARRTAIRACWDQWAGLGSSAVVAGGRSPSAIIDVEALILLSLCIRDEERRLSDMVAWWAEAGSTLTSLQRLRAVAKRFPGEQGEDGLRLFASMAKDRGDRRWIKDADPGPPDWVRFGKGPERPALLAACALWPRLRAGLGVGAKADTLAFLLGLSGAWASANVISFATGYSTVTIGRASAEMAMAGLVRATDDRPTEYMAPPRPWAELLALDRSGNGSGAGSALPSWRFWSEIFAFLAGAITLAERAAADGPKREHVLASSARDLVDRHRRALNLNGILTSPAAHYRGLGAVGGLGDAVRAVAGWVETAM